MSKQKVIISNDLATDIAEAVASCPHDKLFLLADTHTRHGRQHIPRIMPSANKRYGMPTARQCDLYRTRRYK